MGKKHFSAQFRINNFTKSFFALDPVACQEVSGILMHLRQNDIKIACSFSFHENKSRRNSFFLLVGRKDSLPDLFSEVSLFSFKRTFASFELWLGGEELIISYLDSKVLKAFSFAFLSNRSKFSF